MTNLYLTPAFTEAIDDFMIDNWEDKQLDPVLEALYEAVPPATWQTLDKTKEAINTLELNGSNLSDDRLEDMFSAALDKAGVPQYLWFYHCELK